MRKQLAINLAYSGAYFLIAVFLIGVVNINQAWSDENLCDGLNGAAYGLCNAYCNAMKCGTEDQYASDRACERVKNNFFRHSTLQYVPCDDPCLNVICAEGESCVDGTCLCGESPTCTAGDVCDQGACKTPCTEIADCDTLEDCTNGYCVDPCEDPEAVATCPCDYAAVPTNTQCWNPTNPTEYPNFPPDVDVLDYNVQFSPCYESDCNNDSCAIDLHLDICTIYIPDVGCVLQDPIDIPLADALPQECNVTFNEPCGLGPQTYPLTENQHATCLCRLAQYANELAQNPDIQIDPQQDTSFTCEP